MCLTIIVRTDTLSDVFKSNDLMVLKRYIARLSFQDFCLFQQCSEVAERMLGLPADDTIIPLIIVKL